MKKFIVLALALVLTLGITGCGADLQNQASFNGGMFSSTEGDYIIINSSGGVYQDVYKLKDTFVSSPDGSDGWIFEDNLGNSVALGGDAKVIRVKNSTTWDMYTEYHSEISNGLSYFEFISKAK